MKATIKIFMPGAGTPMTSRRVENCIREDSGGISVESFGSELLQMKFIYKTMRTKFSMFIVRNRFAAAQASDQ